MEDKYIEIIAEQLTEIDELKEHNNNIDIDLIVDEIAKKVYFDYDNNDKKVIKDVLIKHINLSK